MVRSGGAWAGPAGGRGQEAEPDLTGSGLFLMPNFWSLSRKQKLYSSYPQHNTYIYIFNLPTPFLVCLNIQVTLFQLLFLNILVTLTKFIYLNIEITLI